MPHKDKDRRREYQREYQRRWRRENPEKVYEIQRRHDRKRYNTPKRKEQHGDVRIRRHHRNKVAVLEKYGHSCAYCGEDRYELLTVDHINNDGARHRQTKKYKRLNVGGMWGYLAMTEFRPDLYQILCWNCNCAKYHYHIYPGGERYKSTDWWKELSKLRHTKGGDAHE